MPKSPEELTIEDVEQALDLPASKWHGQCYGIATGILEAELIEGDPIYGHFLGDISDEGFWRGRKGHPFVQHGWILLPDGQILDPTRFSFENEDPYIYIGDGGTDYDEGGDMWRAATLQPCPVPKGDRVKNQGWELGTNETFAFQLLTGTPFDKMTTEQVFWIANLPYAAMSSYIPIVYPVLKRYDMTGLVPLDNWRRAFREGLINEGY